MEFRKKSIVKKCTFTLLEVIIAMALMSLILSGLAFFFYQINMLNVASQNLENKAFRLRYLENRLMKVLPRTVSINDKQKESYFFTSISESSFNKSGSPYLVFAFDNCVNLVNPLFSNHVIGRIFLDPDKNLSLAITPSFKNWESNTSIPLSREILMNDVETLEFSFFVNPNKSKPQTEIESELTNAFNMHSDPIAPPNGTWVSDWKQDYKQLPVIVAVTITFKENDEIKKRKMLFPVPNAQFPVIYHKA